MATKASLLDHIDPTQVPLPNGTKVTTRIERTAGKRRIPQGAVGQVIATKGGEVEVRLAGGDVVRYLRADVVPTKLGQMRYAVRRERAWQALRPCVVLTTVVGSRAWGLADEHSDTDRRGVFVLPFGWTTALVERPTELISADAQFHFRTSPASGWGWMSWFSPLARSQRERFPYCHWLYTMSGLPGSIAGSKPSPPRVMNQSSFRMPLERMVRVGPPMVLLSCWILEGKQLL